MHNFRKFQSKLQYSKTKRANKHYTFVSKSTKTGQIVTCGLFLCPGHRTGEIPIWGTASGLLLCPGHRNGGIAQKDPKAGAKTSEKKRETLRRKIQVTGPVG